MRTYSIQVSVSLCMVSQFVNYNDIIICIYINTIGRYKFHFCSVFSVENYCLQEIAAFNKMM